MVLSLLRKLLPVLIALTLSLSGCLGFLDEGEPLDEGGDEPGPGDDGNGNGGNGNGDVNETENHPPTASLTADVTSGDAPLAVSFTLDGSDPDDDPLTWTFDPGDGGDVATGESLPATVDHTYEAPGEFTALLTVTDGELSDEATLAIIVDEAPVEIPDPVVINGTAFIGHPLHVVRCIGEGVDGNMHDIEPARGGWSYAAEPADAIALYWYSDSDFLEEGDATGVVPTGATRVEACLTEGNLVEDYGITLWHPDHPDA